MKIIRNLYGYIDREVQSSIRGFIGGIKEIVSVFKEAMDMVRR